LSGPIEEKKPTELTEGEKGPVKRKPRPTTARSAEIEASRQKLLATLQKAKETEEKLKIAEEKIFTLNSLCEAMNNREQVLLEGNRRLGEKETELARLRATIQDNSDLVDAYVAKLKAATWWKSQNWNGDSRYEIYALQQFLVAEFPHNVIPKMGVKVIRAAFCRIGHGTWVILAESDRLLLTSDHGPAHFKCYHVLGWQQGTETQPVEIYTPSYYDPGRHKTTEEIWGVIEKTEWVNAEKKFWELAKGVS